MNETWDPIEAFDVPEHFSRFPAGIAHSATEVVTALRQVIGLSCSPGSNEEKKAMTRHLTADNEPFAICHCTASPQRLVILSSIIELAWINDDVTEELDHKSACEKHDILKSTMDLEKLINSQVSQFNAREALFGLLVQKAAAIDPKSAPRVIQVLSDYLDTFDSSGEDFIKMEDYNPYRVGNCGYWISSFFIRWGMGLTLTDEEYESIRDFDFSMGIILGLTNDYFSWNVEKDQNTDRIRNAVRVLMKEHAISDTIARTLLRGVIVDEEEKACRLKREVLASSPSMAVKEYIKAIELILDAVDQEDMIYWSFSYGTLLGQTYAGPFPERSKRVIIDGVVNQFEWYEEPFETESHVDAERVLDAMVSSRQARTIALSSLATSKEDLRNIVFSYLDKPREQPISVYVNNTVYGLLDYD
ncbi:hypothetical protein BBP40_000366 [Aspergillus hancockii]|nr:hypothetical protein BBP40_000366 [Aspergillus hancockii]